MRYMVIMAIAAVAIFAAALVTLRALGENKSEAKSVASATAPVTQPQAPAASPDAGKQQASASVGGQSRRSRARAPASTTAPDTSQQYATVQKPYIDPQGPSDDALDGGEGDQGGGGVAGPPGATPDALARRIRVGLFAESRCPGQQQALNVISRTTQGWDVDTVGSALRIVGNSNDDLCPAVGAALAISSDALELAVASIDTNTAAPTAPVTPQPADNTTSSDAGAGSSSGSGAGASTGSDDTGATGAGDTVTGSGDDTNPVDVGSPGTDVAGGDDATTTSATDPPGGADDGAPTDPIDVGGGAGDAGDAPTPVGDGAAPGGGGGSSYQDAA